MFVQSHFSFSMMKRKIRDFNLINDVLMIQRKSEYFVWQMVKHQENGTCQQQIDSMPFPPYSPLRINHCQWLHRI